MSKHSPIGASSRYRWSKCPGSVQMSDGMPNVAGPAAIEGTLAHELVAYVLEKAFSKNVGYSAVTDELLAHLDVYLSYVWQLKQKSKVIHIEHSFDMQDIFYQLYGTADCVAFDEENETLHVVDYKHGQGIVVEVENNLQLEYYALGALSTLKYPCRWVQMTIVQPRAYHPDGPIRHWKIPSIDFIEIEHQLIREAKAAMKKDATLLAGTHCMFCPGKKVCPENHVASVQGAKKDFGFYKDPKLDFTTIDVD